SLSICPQQIGSLITLSATFKSYKSDAVNFNDFAASAFNDPSLNSILAAPSGDITEYVLFSNIYRRSQTPNPSAPPDPPSPMTIEIIGTFKPAISTRFLAIASLCTRSSASLPG